MTGAEAGRPPAAVLAEFDLDPAHVRPASSGLINRTWHARSGSGPAVVLQRVNALFPAAINRDIDVLTRHLAAKNLPTPRLVPSRTGELWVEHDDAVWRVLTEIGGVTRDAIETEQQAREAGALLGRFHRAVEDLDHAFSNARLGVHDTAAHIRALGRALEEHRDHRAYLRVRAVADEVLVLAESLPSLPPMPDRVVHGDPKISNIVFERTGDRAVCLIDLDTLARMPVALELGDAMRSWCNAGAEDVHDAELSLRLFESAVQGYAESSAGLLSPAEWRAIPAATLTITVELAARFCADALAERYFGWNRAQFASASEHNLARTRGQVALAQSIRTHIGAMQTAVQRFFAAL